jgi:hypothetical protein
MSSALNRQGWEADGSQKGYGPENMTCLRIFATGVLKSKGIHNVA